MTIKAIETVYNGYRFRSRLEARWAVFFDAAGIPYQYEPEGFDLGEAGWYLPDFRLPEQDIWVEIKGRDRQEFNTKCQALSEYTEFVLCISGDPWPNEYHIDIYTGGIPYLDCMVAFTTEYHRLRDGREKTAWFLEIRPSILPEIGGIIIKKLLGVYQYIRLEEAFGKARQARFEHGETPR